MGPVRYISPASLNLELLHEQNRAALQKKDATKVVDPAPGVAAKGKPRLMLMGQRRLVVFLQCTRNRPYTNHLQIWEILDFECCIS